MFRGFYHAGRMLQTRRKIEAQGGLPGSHSAPTAWSTLLMGCGAALCLAGFLLPATRVLLLVGAPIGLVGIALALLEAILDTR